MRLLADELACVRGGRIIFEKVSFTVAAGETLAITGRNGAGKSSLLRLVAGLVPRAAGTLALEGGIVDLAVGEHVHYCGHADALKPALTALENLAFWRTYLGEPWHEPLEALETLAIDHLADVPASYLSAGQKRRLALARLLVSRRPIWILDEPTAALDQSSQGVLAGLMGEHLRTGGLILAATHGDLGVEPAKTLEMAV
jgi:heme exporter protein A